ncbi:hypothetical protein ACIHAX_10150 [Nocardia sp. NPDC051929]|uniref:hypothetical protein n=1 Tax=unclassified Nocardia TaxID=2637762 RepID=UPI00342AA51A
MFGGRYRGPLSGGPKPGASVSEIDVFAALNVILGKGVLGPPGWVRPDMVFSIEGERLRRIGEGWRSLVGNNRRYDLIVEYDGEYWHRHHERRDITKYPDVGRGYEVMRLRMQPLRRLRPADISVPSRADATTCARLALLHLAHRPRPFLISEPLLERIGFYLQFCATPLAEGDIACGLCAELDHILQGGLEFYPTGSSTFQANRSSLGDFVQRARELSERSEFIEGLWVPDPHERGWEQNEVEAVSPEFRPRHQIALGHHEAQDRQSALTE